MTYVRNRKGQISEYKSRSKENWERGRGAKRKGNPRYKPVIRGGKKHYIVRKRNGQKTSGMWSPIHRIMKRAKKVLG
jgi:hypothetical protein